MPAGTSRASTMHGKGRAATSTGKVDSHAAQARREIG
jgi:hypothetical protein